MILREQIAQTIRGAAEAAQAGGSLPDFELPEIVIERPKQVENGDYACNVALRSAKPASMPPRAIAEAIAAQIEPGGMVGRVEVAGPGFINLHLDAAWLAGQADRIRLEGAGYADLELGDGQTLQVEFVSANPTGPLHFGGARNAAIGDTLARVMAACGFAVQREFYLNDAGSQMQKFGGTLRARMGELSGRAFTMPEDGYQGEYMLDYARQLLAEPEAAALLDLPEDESVEALGARGKALVLQELEASLAKLDVRFDRWFSEMSLYESGYSDTVLDSLRESGLTFEKDGAEWLATSRLGSDRDEVLIRSSGRAGYYASDVAYHHDKFIGRGFQRVIDVWAVDHQNQARRMPFLMQALGLEPERLDIVLYDLVKLIRDGQEVKFSKRAGNLVTTDEVLEEIDADAIRFMLLTRSNEQVIEFDLDLAKQQSNENPVYYVQYAHARICSILRVASERGFADYESGEATLLIGEAELALIREMLRLQEVIELVAEFLAPHHLPHYAQSLAKAFHAFYHHHQVVDAEAPDLSRARLKLVDAARIALARSLDLMGMSAPEEM